MTTTRVMKMADGGFRPAFNIQLASAGSELGGPRTIVGVRVNVVLLGAIARGVIPPVQRRTSTRLLPMCPQRRTAPPL